MIQLAGVARNLGYRVWPPHLVTEPDFATRVQRESVDIILNVHSLHFINEEVLRASRLGNFNLHPGPLPKYAGLNSVSWAIYGGESAHGVTLHWMTPKVDAGPIAFQSLFEIEEIDTALTLSAKCVSKGLQLIPQLLSIAEKSPKGIPAIPQDLTQRQYFGREAPNQSRIYWRSSAKELVNFVRACNYFPFRSPWGHPRAMLGRTEVGIVKATRTHKPCSVRPGTIGSIEAEGVYVACGDEWILVNLVKYAEEYLDARRVLVPGLEMSDGV